MILLEERDFRHRGLNPKDLIGQTVTELHYEETIEKSSYVYLAKDKPVVYLNLDEPRFDELLPYLNSLKFPKSSRKTLGNKNESTSFGALTARENRSTDCNMSALVNKSPELDSLLTGAYSTIADMLMEEYLPQWHRVGHSLFSHSSIHTDWRMAKTFFTSGIINKNSAQNFHYDNSNCRNSYSAMFTMKESMSGGYLVMPQYNVAFKVSNRSLIFFCGREIIHGVSPLEIHKGGYRYSIVYYTTSDMQFCKSHKEETQLK